MIGRRGRFALPVALALLATPLAGCSRTPTPESSSPADTASTTPAPTASTKSAPTASTKPSETTAGVDVSRWQRSVDWPALWASGHRFAWIKATEGTGHRSPTWATQEAGARQVGMLRGGYHYARPAASTGAAQARFFVANGGGWRPDGRTLPGALDLEASKGDGGCHGLTPARMVAWVTDFTTEYERLTGRPPVLYVRDDLWRRCAGDDTTLGRLPLWLYDHEPPMGPWPRGWKRPTVWQRGVVGGLDRNVFLGSSEDLVAWATTP